MTKNSPFLHSLILDGQGKAVPVSEEEVSKWNPSKGLLWVHLDYQAQEAIEWFKNKSKLSSLTVETLTDEDTRPRITSADNGHIIVLRSINSNPGHEPEDMVSLRLWINDDQIISTCHRMVETIEDIQSALICGKGPKTSSEFLIMACEMITEDISDIVAEIGDGIDDLEENILKESRYQIRSEIADFRRMVISIRRYLVPQRDIFSKFVSEGVHWLSEQEILKLRESGERTLRLLEELDTFRDRAIILQEEITFQLSEDMNKAIYMLSIVATIFLPLTLLTGLLGINVGGIPGASYPYAFFIVCGILIVLAIMEYFIFKRKRML